MKITRDFREEKPRKYAHLLVNLTKDNGVTLVAQCSYIGGDTFQSGRAYIHARDYPKVSWVYEKEYFDLVEDTKPE